MNKKDLLCGHFQQNDTVAELGGGKVSAQVSRKFSGVRNKNKKNCKKIRFLYFLPSIFSLTVRGC
jgi:hypothetical protein